MFEDYSWDLTGYVQKYPLPDEAFRQKDVARIFRLEPEPPAAEDLNEYILSALREKDLAFVSFFLHHYEEILNRRIRSFLIRDGSDQYDPERFLDIKLACRMKILEKLAEYDPSSGAALTTFLYPHISDALLEFRKGEEAWSLPSLTTYKMVRRMAQLYYNFPDPVSAFCKQFRCKPETAKAFLNLARGIRNRTTLELTAPDDETETGEDLTRDDSWDYPEIIASNSLYKQVCAAFEKLNYREQQLLEKRQCICMDCGYVAPMKTQPGFDRLAEMFEYSSTSGAERAFQKAVDHLTEVLVKDGALHAVTLRLESKTPRKTKPKNCSDEKIPDKQKYAAAIYQYQADCDGEWGEFIFNCETGEGEILSLAEWDTTKTHRFANRAIRFLRDPENPILPKTAMVAFEQ